MNVTLFELPAVLARVSHGLGRWKGDLRTFGRNSMRDIQQDHALAGWGSGPLWGSGRPLSQAAQEGRRERLGYYRHTPHAKAGLTTRLFWTGHLADATATPTTLTETGMKVDTGLAYSGPIPGSDPVESVARRMHGADIWDMGSLDDGLDDLADDKAERIVRDLERAF